MTVIMEWDEGKDRHRLRDERTGEVTAWAVYQQYTYLRGFVGITAYYGKEEMVMRMRDFIKMTAVQIEPPEGYREIQIEGGKYTIRLFDDYRADCLRYGEVWRDFTGDKLISAMAEEIYERRLKENDQNTEIADTAVPSLPSDLPGVQVRKSGKVQSARAQAQSLHDRKR